jgi:hypothetical protein
LDDALELTNGRLEVGHFGAELVDGVFGFRVAAVHSDGKLTIKSLAEEAQVKRWVLTHRHTDLQAEFRARIDHGADRQPPAALSSAP